MPFQQEYFENFQDKINEYKKIFQLEFITVELRVYGKSYKLYQLLRHDNNTITFVYHDESRTKSLDGKMDKPIPLPAITVPYESIESVEFDPSSKGDNPTMGFKAE